MLTSREKSLMQQAYEKGFVDGNHENVSVFDPIDAFQDWILKDFNKLICRGSVAIGSGCKTCDKCLDEIAAMGPPALPTEEEAYKEAFIKIIDDSLDGARDLKAILEHIDNVKSDDPEELGEWMLFKMQRYAAKVDKIMGD